MCFSNLQLCFGIECTRKHSELSIEFTVFQISGEFAHRTIKCQQQQTEAARFRIQQKIYFVKEGICDSRNDNDASASQDQHINSLFYLRLWKRQRL